MKISIRKIKSPIGIRIPNLASQKLSKHGIHKLRKNQIYNEIGFSKKEITEMMENAGLKDLLFSNNTPYWHVTGKKIQ